MAISTTDSFLQALEKSSLLDSEQLGQARQFASQTTDARSLAKRLVAQGWLTRWQSDLLLAGRTTFLLGKYKLMELLGRGGMGSVYLARHTMMNRPVALKIISKQLGRDPANLERFFTEARAVAALNHPNIVHAYNIDNEGERYYMVMEFVEGQDLQRMVEEQGPLDHTLAAEYIRQAADGLAHAHERNIVHCDIKPANLLVNPQGVVKILDMGMARLVSSGVESGGADEQVLGTVDYMAPELAMQSPQVDCRADIYSLGCTFYFLLTGHPPFPEGSLAERIIKHQMEQPAPILEQRPDVPRDLAEICQRMMAKRPEDRYQSAAEVVARLTERGLTESPLLQATPLEEEPPPTPPTKRPRPASPPPDALAPADDMLAAGGLAFADDILPPAEAPIPGNTIAVRRQSSKRNQLIVPIAASAAALIVLIALVVILMDSLGGSKDQRQAETPPNAQSASVPATTNPPEPAQETASPPSQPEKPAPAKPAPAKKNADPAKAKPDRSVSKPKPPRSEAPSPKATAATSPQPADGKPATPPPAKPQAPAAPAADPLADFPTTFDLPLLGEQADANGPILLGKIASPPQTDWDVRLLGGDVVFGQQRRYVLVRTEAEPTAAAWKIRLQNTVVGTNTLTTDVASLQRTDGASLVFHWAPKVKPEDGNRLRNCILQVRVQDTVRDLRLLTPEWVSPLTLGVHNARSTFDLRWVPPLDRLRVEITKADGPSTYTIKPSEPVGFDTPVRLTYFFKERSGREVAGAVFVFKAMYRAKEDNYSAHLVLQKPDAKVQQRYVDIFRRFETVLPRFAGGNTTATRKRPGGDQASTSRKNLSEQADAAIKEIAASQAKLEKRTKEALSEEQRKVLDGQLSDLDAQLWYLNFYQAIQASTVVHFRVVVPIDDQVVVLASSDAPRPDEPPADSAAP